MEKPCAHCGTVFSFPKYRSETAKYCSRRCLALASRVQVDATCATCGGEFSHISSRCKTAKYCSRECYSKSLKGKGRTLCKCAFCGNEFLASKSQNRKFCSRACTSKQSKETWKPKFSTVRKSMRRRGMINFCERCGYDAEPKILGVHHKDRNRKNNDMDNLEVLCPNCHSVEHLKHIPHGFSE